MFTDDPKNDTLYGHVVMSDTLRERVAQNDF
jgi:hypothetical protein